MKIWRLRATILQATKCHSATRAGKMAAESLRTAVPLPNADQNPSGAAAEDTVFNCSVCAAPCTTRCKSCRIAAYCSRECQKQHWPLHKSKCTPKQTTMTTPSFLREGVRCIIGPNPGTATPLEKDKGGRLMKMGTAKLNVLFAAIAAPDNSRERKELFKQYKQMALEEAQGWHAVDEPAGEAKALFGLASGYMEMGQKHKFVEYMAKVREVLATMPDHDKQKKNLQKIINQQETVFYKHNPDMCEFKGVIYKEADIGEMSRNFPQSSFGQALQLLRQKQGLDEYLIVVVLLEPGSCPEMLPETTRETMARISTWHKLSALAEEASEFLKLQNIPDISVYKKLEEITHRMMVFGNNQVEVHNFINAVKKMGHTARLYHHDDNNHPVVLHFLSALGREQ